MLERRGGRLGLEEREPTLGVGWCDEQSEGCGHCGGCGADIMPGTYYLYDDGHLLCEGCLDIEYPLLDDQVCPATATHDDLVRLIMDAWSYTWEWPTREWVEEYISARYYVGDDDIDHIWVAIDRLHDRDMGF